MKNLIAFVSVFTLSMFTACAVQPEPEPEPVEDDSVCGDGTCNGDETEASCPTDCADDAPVCGDGTCTAGVETSDNCSADCSDTPPPEDSYSWILRPGVKEYDPYLEGSADPMYWSGNTPPDQVWAVGECHALGIYGYHYGRRVLVNKIEVEESDGSTGYWFRVYMGDNPPTPNHSTDEPCILTFSGCEDSQNENCWMQFGLEVPATVAGPFRACDSSGSCASRIGWREGKTPQPLGD